MNKPLRDVVGHPGNQAVVCLEYQLLKRGYESALRETALYECGGGASFQQAIRYEVEAKAVCAAADKYVMAHNDSCPVCKRDKGIDARYATNTRDLLCIPRMGDFGL
jgi:hypothetical protein